MRIRRNIEGCIEVWQSVDSKLILQIGIWNIVQHQITKTIKIGIDYLIK